MANDDQERRGSAQDEKENKQLAPDNINTGGGVYAGGDVATSGGDFTGRDKTVYGDEVGGAKTVGGGELSAAFRAETINIYNANSAASNPKGPETSGVLRSLRGGAFSYKEPDIRCAKRSDYNPFFSLNLIGFRVVSPGP